MTGWLISCDILSASSRPTKSPPPPAAPGTTMVTGCVGKSCAATGAAARPANTIAADTHFHCALLIVVSSINLHVLATPGRSPPLRSWRLRSRHSGAEPPHRSLRLDPLLNRPARRRPGPSWSRVRRHWWPKALPHRPRSEEHTSELQSLMRTSY